MAPPASFARPVVIKAQRETIILIAAVTVVTFALASAIHSRPPPASDAAGQNEPQARTVPDQAWAGGLADVVPANGADAVGETLTSASLVVAKSDLALPAMAVRPLVRLRGCEGSVCAAKVVPTPARRPDGVAATPRRLAARREKQSPMARLNPLDHLPDMSVLGKPFAFAGDAVAGWFRRF